MEGGLQPSAAGDLRCPWVLSSSAVARGGEMEGAAEGPGGQQKCPTSLPHGAGWAAGLSPLKDISPSVSR